MHVLFCPTDELSHLSYADDAPDVPCWVEGNADRFCNVLDMDGRYGECVCHRMEGGAERRSMGTPEGIPYDSEEGGWGGQTFWNASMYGG